MSLRTFFWNLWKAVTRTRLLDYFTARRRATRDDHVLFGFEQSMALGPNEHTFLTQLCLQVDGVIVMLRGLLFVYECAY